MLRIFKHFFFAIVNSKVINNNRMNTSLACFNIRTYILLIDKIPGIFTYQTTCTGKLPVF